MCSIFMSVNREYIIHAIIIPRKQRIKHKMLDTVFLFTVLAQISYATPTFLSFFVRFSRRSRRYVSSTRGLTAGITSNFKVGAPSNPIRTKSSKWQSDSDDLIYVFNLFIAEKSRSNFALLIGKQNNSSTRSNVHHLSEENWVEKILLQVTK